MLKFRVVSNGFGEDLIACKLIEALRQPGVEFDVFPLVGDGHQYIKRAFKPKLQQPLLPSGGFLIKLKDVLQDLRRGLILQMFKQRRTIMDYPADYQLVVGDIYALLMANGSSIPTIFLPTAKSERAIPHWSIEFKIIKKCSDIVFPRDQETHQKMIHYGIQSHFFGNPMFDGMVSTTKQPEILTIGILPGSRDEGLVNLKFILTFLDCLVIDQPVSFLVGLPSHFLDSQLRDMTHETDWSFEIEGANKYFIKADFCVRVSDQFFDVLQESSVIIGLAGTANEQAMFTKRPVISFVGDGPQSSKKRFLQQQQLIEDAECLFIDSRDPKVISEQISNYINHHPFQWTPLSNYYQTAVDDIQKFLYSNFISFPSS